MVLVWDRPSQLVPLASSLRNVPSTHPSWHAMPIHTCLFYLKAAFRTTNSPIIYLFIYFARPSGIWTSMPMTQPLTNDILAPLPYQTWRIFPHCYMHVSYCAFCNPKCIPAHWNLQATQNGHSTIQAHSTNSKRYGATVAHCQVLHSWQLVGLSFLEPIIIGPWSGPQSDEKLSYASPHWTKGEPLHVNGLCARNFYPFPLVCAFGTETQNPLQS